MIDVKILVEDYVTHETAAVTYRFDCVELAQKHIRDHNLESISSIARTANVYQADSYIGRISQNGRFWPVNGKHGQEFEF